MTAHCKMHRMQFSFRTNRLPVFIRWNSKKCLAAQQKQKILVKRFLVLTKQIIHRTSHLLAARRLKVTSALRTIQQPTSLMLSQPQTKISFLVFSHSLVMTSHKHLLRKKIHLLLSEGSLISSQACWGHYKQRELMHCKRAIVL